MRYPGFMEGAVVAFAVAAVGSVLYAALTMVFPADALLRLLIAAAGLAYLLYLLRRSGEPVGRLVTLGFWTLAAAVGALADPPLGLYLLLHCGLIWLVRSLYFYRGVLPALLDLGLSALALGAAVWAVDRTGSLFLTIWCFFLVQALFVTIPPHLSRRPAGSGASGPQEDRFRQAFRAAESALERLSTIR